MDCECSPPSGAAAGGLCLADPPYQACESLNEVQAVRLQSRIIISRSAEQVWEFLGELSNIPQWDRGVAGVKSPSPGPMGVGSTFSTFAREQAAEEPPAPAR